MNRCSYIDIKELAMTCAFPYSEKLEKFEGHGLEKKRDGNWILLESDMTKRDLVELLEKNGLYKKAPVQEFRAHIDCGVCAKKIERELNRDPWIEKAEYRFAKSILSVESNLPRDEIARKALALDDELSLPDDCRRMSFEIDKDEAERIIGEKAGYPWMLEASYDGGKGRLDIVSLLDEEETRTRLAIAKPYRKYTFGAVVDCSSCAERIERELEKVDGIKDVHFNFQNRRLTLSSSLERDEIVASAKKADNELTILDEDAMEFDVRLSRRALGKLKAHEGINSARIEDGRLFINTSLERKKVEALVDDLSVKDRDLARIIAAAILFVASHISGVGAIAILAYLVAGYDVLAKAARNIVKGHVFDENFLMSIATIGALAISSYEEAAGVMIFYQIGEYLQKKALGRSRRNISSLLDLTEDEIEVLGDDGPKKAKAKDVGIGTRFLVRAGEKISLDAIVREGKGSIDEKAITGESLPREVAPGSLVPSGAVNGEAALTLEAVKRYEDSTAARIMKLVRDGEERKAASEKFITRFSRYYTPIVCLLTILVATIPPLVAGTGFRMWLYRGLMLLVISCPCALVLSVPLTYFASIGAFARKGILVKNAETIEKLSKTAVVAFDKTGTLTRGSFVVTKVECPSMDSAVFMDIASSLEAMSTHPIAKAVADYGKGKLKVEDFREVPGKGIEGRIGDDLYFLGRDDSRDEDGLAIKLEKNGAYVGTIVLEDEMKQGARDAVESLSGLGVSKTVMLSGDRRRNAERIGSLAGLDEVKAPLLPHEKLEELEKLLSPGRTVVYVGDGINDAPSLMRADVGISMGSIGSDAAIESSDAVIMNDNLESVATAIRISRRTETIVRENIVFSIGIKVLIMILGILGYADMWLAVFADTGVALIATINAMRALKTPSR